VSKWYPLLQWMKHRWKARRRHGVHSPFVYHFSETVLHHSGNQPLQTRLEQFFHTYDIQYHIEDIQKAHENTVVLVKGIHQSPEKTVSWNVAIADSRVTMSIDLYSYGVLLFHKEFLEKQHFVLR